MNEQLRRNDIDFLGVGEEKRNSSYLLGKSKTVASSVAAVLAFAVGLNQAKADTGTIDDIAFDKNLNSANPSANALLADNLNNTFSLELGLGDGGAVELNANYIATASSDKKTLEIRDVNTNLIKESFTFPSTLLPDRSVVALGEGYFVVNGGEARVFNVNEVGTANFGFSLQSESSYGFPVYLEKHPSTGSIVGVTLSGRLGSADFFSYATGSFMSSHPVPGAESKVEQAFQSLGAMDSNGFFTVALISSNVMPDGNVYFAYQDTNGDYQQWINPESNEVVVPDPIVQAPESFSLNVADVLSGKKLEVAVSNVPENGSVVLELAGERFVMTNAGGDNYELVLTQSELESIQGGEFSEVAVIKVLDESGAEVVTASLDISVDVVNPDAVQFEVEGAEIVSMGGVDIYSLESEEIPVEVTLVWEDGALMNLAAANVAVASIPLPPGTSMADFVAQSDQDKIDFVMGNVNITSDDQGGMLPKSGTLGTVKSIDDLSATSVAVEVSEGPHAVAILGTDAAGNLSVSIRVVDVNKVDNNDMSCAENPDQDKCETPVETCETNPELPECEVPAEETCETNPDLAECETEPEPEPEPEPTPGPGVDGGSDGGAGSDEEGGGCATPGQDGSPSTPLSLLVAGVAAVGLRKRKRKIPKSSK